MEGSHRHSQVVLSHLVSGQSGLQFELPQNGPSWTASTCPWPYIVISNTQSD